VSTVSRPTPLFDSSACSGCGACIVTCPKSAIAAGVGVVVVDALLCVGCCDCIEVCPTGALYEKDSAVRHPARGAA
jgi:ferredoxin